MKKTLLSLALLTGWTEAGATDYTTMAFRHTDGTVTLMAADGLDMAFSGGNLIATSSGAASTMQLSTLEAMYFSSATTGISASTSGGRAVCSSFGSILVTGRAGDEVRVYDTAGTLRGKRTLQSAQPAAVTENLPAGVYIVRVGDETTKILVK